MATTIDDMKKDPFPLVVYYYEVKIDEYDPINFSEVSGISIEYDTITYKDGMSYKEGERHMPGQSKPVNLTLKKGMVRADNKLFDWINSVHLNTCTKRDITISLKDADDAPVVSWKVFNAFPKKLDAPGFNAGSNEVAIESLELMADRLTIEYA